MTRGAPNLQGRPAAADRSEASRERAFPGQQRAACWGCARRPARHRAAGRDQDVAGEQPLSIAKRLMTAARVIAYLRFTGCAVRCWALKQSVATARQKRDQASPSIADLVRLGIFNLPNGVADRSSPRRRTHARCRLRPSHHPQNLQLAVPGALPEHPATGHQARSED
jgi:hypothetical protein